MAKAPREFSGILIIGDPHVEGRCPGHRSDDYPNVILEKIRWCLNYAARQNLLPAFLGDFFDKPRDNPIWLVGQLIEMLRGSHAVGIYGNHDCAEPELNENDSLSILLKAGCLQLVSEDRPWVGTMGGRPTKIGGSSYRHPVPTSVVPPPKLDLFDEQQPFVVWLTHHDISVPDYDNGKFLPHEIENCDLLINGHIHTRKESVKKGQTLWMTPGNIARRSRKEATRQHVPRAVHIEVSRDQHTIEDVVIPHEPFDQVFYPAVAGEVEEDNPITFVSGLAELMARKTESGAGLHDFLDQNIDQFEPDVASEILKLAAEVTDTMP